MTSEQSLRQQLVDTARQLNSSGLSPGKSGNLSLRNGDQVLITPSAVDYAALTTDDIVALSLQGDRIAGDRPPSSEWPFHCALYRERSDISAVVHAHARHATALACCGRDIPAFHYMVAVAGGKRIPLAPYALFGSEQLSKQVVDTLSGYRACLLANHGLVAVGDSLASAFALAGEVEELAAQYCLSLAIGPVQLLSDAQMDAVVERFKHYGRRD